MSAQSLSSLIPGGLRVTYVKRILRLDALAPSGERRHSAGDLEPLSQVCLELEADVGFGVVAVSVPRRGHGVDGFF